MITEEQKSAIIKYKSRAPITHQCYKEMIQTTWGKESAMDLSREQADLLILFLRSWIAYRVSDEKALPEGILKRWYCTNCFKTHMQITLSKKRPGQYNWMIFPKSRCCGAATGFHFEENPTIKT